MVGDVLCIDINRELDKRELGQAMTDRRGNWLFRRSSSRTTIQCESARFIPLCSTWIRRVC